MQIIRAAVLVFAVSLMLAGCGKKGPPEAPGKSEYPRTYPSPR